LFKLFLLGKEKVWFDKDLKRMLRRGKEAEKIKDVIRKLINEERLDEKYRDHLLRGNYKGCRDCHVEPDWILIYRIYGNQIQFLRTGSHSDLFR
jgi:mRNA interferase YafQ